MMFIPCTSSSRFLILCAFALLAGIATGQTVSVDAYGAVGDGVTDDTNALNLAFALAPPGSTILIPAGRTYVHTDIVEIIVPSVLIKGGGRLLATNEARSGVWINADYVVMEGIVLEMKSTTTRWMGYEQMKLRLMNSRGIVVRGVTIEGAAAAGIYIGNTHDYLIDRVIVRNTRSDAIHNTEASSFGTIIRPDIFNSGDDGVAFVSYRRDGSQVNNMILQSPKFRLQKIGRGFSVVGSRDIVMNDLYAEDSDAASLYVGCEPYFDTFGVSNVQVNGGLFYRSNKNQEWDRQGSVHIFNGRPDEVIRNITINNIRSVYTKGNQPHEVGIKSSGSGGVFGVELRGLYHVWRSIKKHFTRNLRRRRIARFNGCRTGEPLVIKEPTWVACRQRPHRRNRQIVQRHGYQQKSRLQPSQPDVRPAVPPDVQHPLQPFFVQNRVFSICSNLRTWLQTACH
ncbi:polygalacturonase [Fragilaria crotonensis]|nr:polygalacturonase [Fragilaria crotonensis]